MDDDDLDVPSDLELPVPSDEGYRTCSTCGGDCEPDTSLSADGTGVRIAFACEEHGVQGIVDPFSDLR